MASILKSKSATDLINVGVGLVVNWIGGLFKSKVKPKIAELNNATATLMAEEKKQSQTITFLIVGIVILAIVAIFIFVVKRKRA